MAHPRLRRPRRLLLALWAAAGLMGAPAWAAPAAAEQWGLFELSLPGSAEGNPFTEVDLAAIFQQGDRVVRVGGFYDGDGTYRIRFMPATPGRWTYRTASNRPELDGRAGELAAAPAAPGNHGPVGVRNIFHFAYADGTPYREIGTTCYAWVHQSEALQAETLATLATAPFNKLRFCVFPKWYEWNHVEPLRYPFAGTAPNRWDFTRFNPAYFQHFERRIAQLRELGIEADLILFHPYDGGHWGFDRMGPANDDRYLRYVVARFAAYRNVWWSMANEYDFMREKRPEDWDRFFQLVQAADPYQHLRSIHNGAKIYDNGKPWVTHASIQNGSAVEDYARALLYRDVYRKPVVFDEVKYEGDLPQRWGDLSAEEMVLRFWEGTVAGTYVGHGETYRDPHDIIWWARGGRLHGQSPARLAFLRQVLAGAPPEGIDPIDKWQDNPFAGKPGRYYLGYLGRQAPTAWKFSLYKTGVEDGMRFRVEVIDTWNMRITPVDGVFVAKKKDNYTFEDQAGRAIPLPGIPYLALRIRRVE